MFYGLQRENKIQNTIAFFHSLHLTSVSRDFWLLACAWQSVIHSNTLGQPKIMCAP